jgi:hypothetical protein
LTVGVIYDRAKAITRPSFMRNSVTTPGPMRDCLPP